MNHESNFPFQITIIHKKDFKSQISSFRFSFPACDTYLYVLFFFLFSIFRRMAMVGYVHQIPLWSTLLSSTRSLCIPFVHYTHFVFWFWLYQGFVLGEIYYVNCRKNTENVKALKHLQKMKCVAYIWCLYRYPH